MENRTVGVWIWVNHQLHTITIQYPSHLFPITARLLFLRAIRQAVKKDEYFPLDHLAVRAREITAIFFET